MVLHVLAHVGEVHDRADVELTELFPVTDSRQH